MTKIKEIINTYGLLGAWFRIYTSVLFGSLVGMVFSDKLMPIGAWVGLIVCVFILTITSE